MGHVLLEGAYRGKGMYSESLEEQRVLDSLFRPAGAARVGAAREQALRSGGVRALFRRTLETQVTQWRAGRPDAYGIAASAAQLGDRDAAFQWLDSAYKVREWLLIGIRSDFQLDSIRSDPRFPALVRKIRLPE
jgi:hypothetical protein